MSSDAQNGFYAVIDWRRVPWMLWVYSALTLVGVILIEVHVHGQVPSKVLFPLIMLAWLFFLLKGVRWVWIVTLSISVLGFAGDLISWFPGVAGHRFGNDRPRPPLLPVTRRYYRGEPAVGQLGPL